MIPNIVYRLFFSVMNQLTRIMSGKDATVCLCVNQASVVRRSERISNVEAGLKDFLHNSANARFCS